MSSKKQNEPRSSEAVVPCSSSSTTVPVEKAEILEIKHQLNTNDDIREQIELWKEGKTRIEYFRLASENIDLYKVLEGIETKPSGYKDYFGVERDSDGLMACIGFTEEFVEFILRKNCPEEKKPAEVIKFPLFSLPFLPLKAVFNEMNPADALEISLLSKKSKIIIKNCEVKIDRIILDQQTILLKNECSMFSLFRLAFYLIDQKSCETRMIGTSRFDSWVNAHEESTREIYCTLAHENDIMVAFNYFLDIYEFKYIECRVWCPVKNFIENTLHLVPKSVTQLSLCADSFNDIDTFLDYFEKIDYLEINAGVLMLPDRVSNIPSIFLTNSYNLPLEDLMKLNCSEITLWNHFLTNEQVRTWVTQWKKNESNVKQLNIARQFNNYSLDFILEEFDKKPCRTRNERDRNEYSYSILDDTWEIQRDSDGKKASLGYKEEYLEFRVWDD